MSMTVQPISISEQISVSAQLGVAQPPGAGATNQDVTTELALGQSAFDSNAVGTIANTFAASPLNQPASTTNTIIDPATQSYMFQMLDVLNGNFVSAAPCRAPPSFGFTTWSSVARDISSWLNSSSSRI